jgi:hypothetical protein
VDEEELMDEIAQRISEAKKKWLLDQVPRPPQSPTVPGIARGELGRPWKGIDPSAACRHWLVGPRYLEELNKRGGITWIDGSPYLGIPGLVFDPEFSAEVEQAREIIKAWLQRRLNLWDENFVGWLFEQVADIPDGPERYSKLYRLACEASGEQEPQKTDLSANPGIAEKDDLQRAFEMIDRRRSPSVNVRELYAEVMTPLYCLLGERVHGALLCCERKALMHDFDLANLVGDVEALKRLARDVIAVTDEVNESLDREMRLWNQCPDEDLVWVFNQVERAADAAEVIHAQGRPDLTAVRRRRGT